MTTTALELNPFSLMMEPELVLQTMERSQQLRGLRRHKLRPLDKPLIPFTKEALASRAAFDAAIDAEDPLDSMRQVHSMVDGARMEPANDLVEPVASILNRLPTTAVTALFGSMVKAVDFTTSNVPGAPFPVYLGGAKMEAQFPFGPLAGAALNITLLSYQNDLNIGIASDPAAVPDPDVLVRSLQAGFDEILAVAAKK